MKRPLAIAFALVVLSGAAWAQGGGSGGSGGGASGGSGGAGSTGGAAGSSGSSGSLIDPTRGTNATTPARPGLGSTTGSASPGSAAPGETLGVRPRQPSESERAGGGAGGSVTGAGSPQATLQFENGTPRIMAPER
jgi:endoglucanase